MSPRHDRRPGELGPAACFTAILAIPATIAISFAAITIFPADDPQPAVPTTTCPAVNQ